MCGKTPQSFRVALTADFYNPDGTSKYDEMGLSLLDEQPHISYCSFPEHRTVIGADQIGDANGVIVLTPAVARDSLVDADDLLAIGRFGVGYELVDVEACTEADVVAYITPGAVDRPVAEVVIGWMIALTHHALIKDQLVRTGGWDVRSQYMGHEIRSRTFGAVGLGGIARETIRLLTGFGMNQPLAFDPYVDEAEAESLGVRLASLDELLEQADFLSIHCPLNDATRNLIGARELALMKRNAYLINTARGGIVDEDALYEALKANRIAGAAIDCFVGEPITSPHRFGDLENVILAPHCAAWTDELFRDIGRAVCGGMVDLSTGRKPKGVLNPEVFDKPSFQRKWTRVCGTG